MEVPQSSQVLVQKQETKCRNPENDYIKLANIYIESIHLTDTYAHLDKWTHIQKCVV